MAADRDAVRGEADDEVVAEAPVVAGDPGVPAQAPAAIDGTPDAIMAEADVSAAADPDNAHSPMSPDGEVSDQLPEHPFGSSSTHGATPSS